MRTLVATDGYQEYLHTTPRAKIEYPLCENWQENNPQKAAKDFVKKHPGFNITEPPFIFNEGNIDFRITYWPSAFIKRIT